MVCPRSRANQTKSTTKQVLRDKVQAMTSLQILHRLEGIFVQIAHQKNKIRLDYQFLSKTRVAQKTQPANVLPFTNIATYRYNKLQKQ